MTLKKFILARIQLFFFLVTLILVASGIFGSIVAPEEKITYQQLFSPVIIAGLCILPTCVTYFKKEPTLKQYIIRMSIELLLIEGVVMFLVKAPKDMEENSVVFYVILGIVIIVIYILAMLMMWYQKYSQSKKLTENLKYFQSMTRNSNI